MHLFRHGNRWSKQEAEEFLSSETAKWNGGDKLAAFAVHTVASENTSKRFLGTSNSYYRKTEFAAHSFPEVAEMGYAIRKDFWGKGYGTELAVVNLAYTQYIAGKWAEFPLANKVFRPAPSRLLLYTQIIQHL